MTVDRTRLRAVVAQELRRTAEGGETNEDAADRILDALTEGGWDPVLQAELDQYTDANSARMAAGWTALAEGLAERGVRSVPGQRVAVAVFKELDRLNKHLEYWKKVARAWGDSRDYMRGEMDLLVNDLTFAMESRIHGTVYDGYRVVIERLQRLLENGIPSDGPQTVDKLRELVEVQGQHGNWDYDPYMHGMFNGMELLLSLLEGREPQFRKAPEAWGCDHVIPDDLGNSVSPDDQALPGSAPL